MINFDVKVSGDAVDKALLRLILFSQQPQLRQALIKIASVYQRATEGRFSSMTAPTGRPWKRNTTATKRLKATGGLGKPVAIDGPTHVGVWTGKLASSIKYEVVGNSIRIGSAMPYASLFQEGHAGKKPWGSTPARPFLGSTKRADTEVLQVLKRHFESALR